MRAADLDEALLGRSRRCGLPWSVLAWPLLALALQVAATTLLLLPADALHAAPWRQGPVAALEADLAMRGRLARGLPDGEGAGASSLGGSAAFGARAAGWQAGSMVASLAIAFVAVAGVAAGSGSGQNRAVGAMWQAVVRTAGLSIAAITLTASVTLGLDKSLVVGPVTVPASTMVAASSVYSWLALPWPSRPARALAWHEHLRSGLALLGFLRPVVLLGPGRVPGVPNSVFVPFTVVVVLALVGLRLLVERRPTAAPEVDTDGTELARQQDSSHGLPSPSLSPSEVWVAAVATMTALPAAVAIVSTTFRANTAAALPLPLHPACVSPAQGGWPLAAPSSAHGRDPAPVCAGSCWELPLTACPSERTMELVSLSLIITTHLAGALLAAYSVHALSMTQTRVLASQLEASKQRVLASNQGLRQFLGFVSHEVRNPLAAAQLAIDAAAIRFAPEQAKAGARAAPTEAERPGLPLASPAGSALTTGLASPFPPAPRADCEGLQQDFRDVLDEIQASLSAARAVLDDVLEYQSIMHSDATTREGQGATALGGRVRLTPRWFQASFVTSQVALVFGAGARVSGVRLQVDCAAGRVFADRKRISQVIFNLVSNAVKYSPEGSTVQVSLSLERDASDGGEASTRSGTSGSGLTAGVAAGDRSAAGPDGDVDDEAPEPAWLQVSVKDEGKGMTKDESSRLFSRFGRLEGADDGLSAAGSRMSGSGLGLSIVRSLVEAMDGKVWVDSTAGRGSRFVARMRVGASRADAGATLDLPSIRPPSGAASSGAGTPSSAASVASSRDDQSWPDRGSRARADPASSLTRRAKRASRRGARRRSAAAAGAGGDERVAAAANGAEGSDCGSSGLAARPGRCVWVVDDAAPVRRVMASLLRRSAGAAVSEFEDGQAALEAVQALAAAAPASGAAGAAAWPQVVFVDNHMPRLDGRGFLAAAVPLARAAGREVRFVAITGETQQEVFDPLLAAGAAAVLCKPVRAPELLAEVVA